MAIDFVEAKEIMNSCEVLVEIKSPSNMHVFYFNRDLLSTNTDY